MLEKSVGFGIQRDPFRGTLEKVAQGLGHTTNRPRDPTGSKRDPTGSDSNAYGKLCVSTSFSTAAFGSNIQENQSKVATFPRLNQSGEGGSLGLTVCFNLFSDLRVSKQSLVAIGSRSTFCLNAYIAHGRCFEVCDQAQEVPGGPTKPQ